MTDADGFEVTLRRHLTCQEDRGPSRGVFPGVLLLGTSAFFCFDSWDSCQFQKGSSNSQGGGHLGGMTLPTSLVLAQA